MLRKFFVAALLFGQILLFAASAGNRPRTSDPGPAPPCGPCPPAAAVR